MASLCLYYKVDDRQKISRYELDLINSGLLAQALPLSLKEKDAFLLLQLSLPSASESLLGRDSGLMRDQALGLRRILLILEAMRDAKERLLRPSFGPLHLSTVFLDPSGIRLPLLPLAEEDCLPWPQNDQQLDFWQEWASFYGVQAELAAVGRRLSIQGKFEELSSIYRSYLEKSEAGKQKGQTTSSRLPLKPLTASASRPDVSQSLPYQAGLKAGLLAELYLLQAGSQFLPRKRLALLADQEFILGRDPSRSDLCFSDPCIGRQHAKISKENGQFFLEDLASLNGTFLEGRLLLRNESLLLAENCHIRLGRIELYFRRLPDQYSPLAADSFYFVPNRRSPASPRPGTI